MLKKHPQQQKPQQTEAAIIPAKKMKLQENHEQDEQQVKQAQLNFNKYDKFIGIDPGLKLMVGCVAYSDPELTQETSQLLKVS